MEKKKNNKGLIITIVILIILLLGLAGYICYDKYILDKDIYQTLEKCENDLKVSGKEKEDALNNVNQNEKNNLTSTNEKNYIVSKIHSDNDINVYAICNEGIFYAYNGNMYFGKSDNNNYYDIMYNSNPNTSDKKSGISVLNYNIKESDVKKIIVTNNNYTSDAQQSIYFIMSDGSVRVYSSIDIIYKDYKNILKKYKVSDLSVIGCGKTGELGCKTLKYELVLNDGSKKVVEE